MTKITILTLATGADYKKKLSRCLQSKRDYAEKHGYKYIEGGDEWRDYSRPISWSKMGFFIHHLQRGEPDEIFWLSDADVYITNHSLRIEDHILPVFPENKDLLFCVDAYDHINAGNIFARPTARVIDWLKRVDGRKECINHIWWENGGMLLEWQDHPEDLAWTEIREGDSARFNAYLKGLEGRQLWSPGTWLIHFAGIYNPDEINKCIDLLNKDLSPQN
jgi:hypothetical protein